MFLSVGEGLIDPPERCQFAQKMTSQYESNGTNVREEGGARKEGRHHVVVGYFYSMDIFYVIIDHYRRS